MRLRVDFAYDGTDFSGWAAQPGRRAVESELSAALSRVLRAPEPVRLVVAGRTDAGVHAAGAVCHADVDEAAFAALPGRSDRTPQEAAVTRLNGVLPPDVVVRDVQVAPEGFDARFSALRRRYRYRLCDDVRRLDPVRRRDTVVHKRALDVAAMDAAARNLLGLHDFAAFCKKREGATTVRTLLDYSWVRGADGVLEATVLADAFCHSMVRSLVGAVVPVGEGRREVDWPAQVLSAGRRDPAVAVMPPHGLSLVEVVYPPDDRLAERATQARATRELPATARRAPDEPGPGEPPTR
ncbi:tRNA pseudouridine38-40 synthase [Barrientosiimonas humi]|uniref:tRNA pseudouridine synthase A n=1 Tax=Barrientosiimonas humi TaxID=999931 RepID=A0A542X8V3_9MICO|nr:tRNA pseudouridine(38-40) synthase TruA [Barrientosiimonas humi]TQL32261.1 tRNA pseudouridine38-40 synthase [Barrientosiimonas humi]CAG7572249.1 tRNA pseudouridine synthase A [Barrientosiimonas humi]